MAKGNQLEKYPENTVMALKEAYRIGIKYVECDVQITRDGHVIVLHDSTLQRTAYYDSSTGLSLEEFEQIISTDVEQLYVADISKIRIGDSTRFTTVPLLEEFVKEICLDKDYKLLIELKRGDLRIVRAIQDLLSCYLQIYNEQILIISFDLSLLSSSKKILPQFKHIFLLTSSYEENEAQLKKGRYSGLYHRVNSYEQLLLKIDLAKKKGFDGLSFEFIPLFDHLWLQKVKQEGFMTYVWFHEEYDQLSIILWMLANGVDLIATNQPEQILSDYSQSLKALS